MSEEELKHFMLKNQAFIETKKVGKELTERHREFDYVFEFDLSRLTLDNQIRLAEDLADYMDKFHAHKR